MMGYSRIIFVCRSNTSRSPMAEAIFKYGDKPRY